MFSAIREVLVAQSVWLSGKGEIPIDHATVYVLCALMRIATLHSALVPAQVGMQYGMLLLLAAFFFRASSMPLKG